MQNTHIATAIKNLCKVRGVTITTLLTDCNLTKSFIYDLEKRSTSPSCDKLTRIAERLDCSVDYLLGLTDEPEELIIPPEDAELLDKWEKIKNTFPNLSPEKKKLIKRILTFDDDDAKKASKMVDTIYEKKQ